MSGHNPSQVQIPKSKAHMMSEVNFMPDAKTEPSLDTVLEVNEGDGLEKLLEVGEYIEDSPRVFGKKTVKEDLSLPSLNNVIYELGIVNLCWPEIKEPVFETRSCFPESYYTNTHKERLLLAYAENFRRQFHFYFKKTKRPLLLQAPNECGLQKMVCTTLKPTKLSFTGTSTWRGLARLVADYFVYEPLTKPMLHPERIMSPFTCLVRRAGNPFEIATVLVSWLLGAHYDAYLVVGCAKRDTCLNIRYRSECPDVPDERPKEEPVPEVEEEPRYRLVPLPDFNSKYLLEMERRAYEKEQKELQRAEDEKRARIAELEQPPPDDIDGWRTHAWVLIMPSRDVTENMFIEPAEGNSYPLHAPQYQGIDAIYNNENYYANIQLLKRKKIVKEECETIIDEYGEEEEKKEEEFYKPPAASKQEVLAVPVETESVEEEEEDIDQDCSYYSYDLGDLNCWEHLLAGEPNQRRNLVGVDISDYRTAVETEKHLDMPASWVEKLDITAEDYQQRYPGCHKVIHYKKVLLELFSTYSQSNGIVKRITVFDDYALTMPLITFEYYSNRVDKMDQARINHVNNVIEESFLTGRPENLKKHTYKLDSQPTSVEAFRTLEFDYYSRMDHLSKIVCTPVTFDEYYIHREDRLESRHITYTEPTKSEPRRQIKDAEEVFSRNPDVPAVEDVWRRIYHIQDNTIELLYHYQYNFVTNNTRQFIKPNLAETGGKILFDPDKTTGYIADACAMPPRPLDVYYSLCENMSREYKTSKHIRDRESDVISYLTQRYKEITEPEVYVSLFSTERNEEAQRAYLEQEKIKAEIQEREKEAEIDPLAPYIARMLGTTRGIDQPLSLKQAAILREQCINDFKAKQLARQVLVQERFDKLNAEYKNKRLWYLANQFILTTEKEAEYFAASAELAFQVHTLEVRLTRHKDLSAARYRAIEDYLDKHPLLREYNAIRYQRTMK